MNIRVLILMIVFSGVIHSEWYRQSYTSPDVDLYKTYFITQQTGFVLGSAGTILKTTDGGFSWKRIECGLSSLLSEMLFITEEKGWAGGSEGVLMKTTDGGNTWEKVETGTLMLIQDIFFLTEEIGWFSCDNGFLKKTTDGGETWFRQTPDTISTLLSIQFLTENTGLIVTRKGVLKTTDGGETWVTKLAISEGYFKCLRFPQINKGYAAGDIGYGYGLVWKTTDAGETWTKTNFGGDVIGIDDMVFADSLRGWYVGMDYWFKTQMSRTLNGGDTWQGMNVVSLHGSHINSIDFINSTKGWAVGSGGDIFRCDDGTSAWVLQDDGLSRSFSGVDFIDDSTGWIAGGSAEINKIMKSTDGGKSWTGQPIESGNNLLSIFALDENYTWVSGENGTIYFTPDGGNQWMGQVTGTTYDLRDIRFLSGNSGWAVGGDEDNGIILHTTDTGMSWIEQDCDTAKNLNSISFVSNLAGWAAGDNGDILKTTNGGEEWTLRSLGSKDDIITIEFFTPAAGFALADDKLFKTADGGDSWTELNNIPAHNGFSAMDFISETGGWILDKNGIIYNTTDGGITWQQEETEITGLSSMHFSESGNGWIVGEDGAVLSNIPQTVVAVEEEKMIIGGYSLSQNYPNPFNPATKIKYSIPAGQKVELKIFDLLGREITTLVNEYKSAGHYETEFNGEYLSSGVYLYRLTTGDYSETKKMLLIK